MTFTKTTKFAVAAATFALACVSLAPETAAQSASATRQTSQTFGNSDAGVTVGTRAYMYGARSVTRRTSGSGRYQLVYDNENLRAKASGYAYADLRFLGRATRAGQFHFNMDVSTDIQRTTSGSYMGRTCSQNGSTLLRVGNTTLWNAALTPIWSRSVDYRIRVMTPTLTLPVVGGVVAMYGRAYGRMHGRATLISDLCNGRVTIDGDPAVSGNGYASLTVISLFVAGSVSVSFYANDQKLDCNNFRVAFNAYGRPTRSGSIVLRSGSMRGYVKLNLYLPPWIPISRTLANWSRGATTTTLF